MIVSTHTGQDLTKLNIHVWDPPGGPVVNRLPSNARGVGSLPGWGSKIDPTCRGATKPCPPRVLQRRPAEPKSMCFYTLVTVSEGLGKQFQFITASKSREHLNLTKEVKTKYTENFKTFITEMEEDTNKWKI